MQDDSPRGKDQAPKVQAGAFAEAEEDVDVNLDDVVYGDGKEAGDGHGNGDGEFDAAAVALLDGHVAWRVSVVERVPRQLDLSESAASRACGLADDQVKGEVAKRRSVGDGICRLGRMRGAKVVLMMDPRMINFE